jgi:methyl-accepting chemotaxis protein
MIMGNSGLQGSNKMKLKDMSIGVKLVVILSGLILLSSAGLSLIAFTTTRSALQRSISGNLPLLARETANYIQARINTYMINMENIASNQEMKSMDWERQQVFMGAELTRLGFLGMAVVSPDGTATYHDNTTAQLGDCDYVKQAFDKKTVLSDVLVSRVTNQPVMMLATPIYSKLNVVDSVLIARLDGNMLSNITDRIKHGSNGYSYIINKDGVIIAHPDRDNVLKLRNFIQESTENPEFQGIATMMKRMINGETSFGSYTAEDGTDMIFGFAPIPRTEWFIAVGASEDEVFADIRNMGRTLMIFLFAVVALAMLLTVTFARRLAKPIVNVKTILKDISDGEGDLTRQLPVTSQDEIGRMSHYFNQTFGKIRKLVVLIKDQAGILHNIGTDMAGSMTQTAAAIIQITANINGVKNQIQNQSAGVEESNATVESIAGSIEKLNEHIESQSASIIESSAAIAQMIANIESVSGILVRNTQNVKELMHASEIGQNGINAVSENIKTIARESEGLLETSSIIAKIANQTNLLAMNAAIEAAHAGEAGQGFAVVADEIRNLAASSGAQAKNITNVLKDLKSSIDTVSNSSSNALKQFETIVSMVQVVSEQEMVIHNAMQEQNGGSKQILEALAEITHITNEVRDRSGEMLTGSRDVLAEMKQLALATHEIRNSMIEMAAGTQEINSAVQHVDQISIRNKDSIDTLITEIGRF